jgi:hypothetical protein
MTGVDRPVDFFRDRHMLCGCGQRWTVDLDWIDRWEQAEEECPGCGATCEGEAAPRVTVAADDPTLIDSNVPRLAWYHTSTLADWPPENLDPATELTERTRRMIGGDEGVARWAERQRSKALHIGTYEAAIHNMLRRIHDQAGQGQQFYLYRVRLRSTVALSANWLIDPSNFVGDVILDEVCPPGIDVARYLNYHEDPGGLSLAIGRDAIAATQRVAIPLEPVGYEEWVSHVVADLAAVVVDEPSPARAGGRRRAPEPSPREMKASEVVGQLAQRLPLNLRHQFEAASVLSDAAGLVDWGCYVIGLVGLIENPARVFSHIDAQEVLNL